MLETIRRRTRNAWWLHAWLILSLLLLPAGRIGHAYGEEGDDDPVITDQSLVIVTVSPPQGTSGMHSGESRPVAVHVELSTWQLWTYPPGSTAYPSGGTEIHDLVSEPISETGLSSAASGDGSVSPGNETTDSFGNAGASFTMGSGASTITVIHTDSGSTGSITFEEPLIEETWELDHDEKLLIASLSPTGTTGDLPVGAVRDVQLHAEYQTWGIYNSNMGRTKSDLLLTSPAGGATISWSVDAADGAVAGSSTADTSGNATAAFTIGATDAVVRADVDFATINKTTYATLNFSAQETWTVDHLEKAISGFTLGVNGTAGGLSPGDVRTLTATVTYDVPEYQVSNRGGARTVNYPEPAEAVSVSFTRSNTSGSLSASSALTDADGDASVDFIMGNAQTTVTASAEGGWSGSITFGTVAEVWAVVESGSTLQISDFSPDDSVANLRPGNIRTLTATVMRQPWEFQRSNLLNERTVTLESTVASGVTVEFTVDPSGGSLSPASATTDSSGLASVTFTMGTQASVVTATVPENGASAPLPIGLGAPVWTEHPETEITTTLRTVDGVTVLQNGASRLLIAHVDFITRVIRTYDTGISVVISETSGAAEGAPVSFSVAPGNGTLANADPATDSSGDARVTFTMGNQNSTVRADAEYLTATSVGSLDLTLDPWAFVESRTVLQVALAPDTAASMLTSTVTVYRCNVYTDGTTYEDRDVSISPAGYAPVNFSASSNVTVPSGTVPMDVTGVATVPYSCTPGTSGTITANAQFSTTSETLYGSATVTVEGPPPPPALFVATQQLPAGVVNVAYPGQVSASGGTAPYTWSATGLPYPLAMTTGGAITGTPVASGTCTVHVTVEDGAMQSAFADLTLVIAESLEITTSQLSGGTVDAAYSQQVSASGGSGSYSFGWESRILPGEPLAILPPGLTMGSGGLISGTPTWGGTYGVTVTVQDGVSPPARKDFTIIITYPLVISTTTLVDGMETEAYSANLTGWGGSGTYSWSVSTITAGLPPGLSLGSYGTITGTPTAPGTYPFIVYLTDSTSTVSKTLSITIVYPLRIKQDSLPEGTVGEPYVGGQADATGGNSPYVLSWEPWAWLIPGPPPGLTMASGGAITGTPTQAGAYGVRVTATDSGPNPNRKAEKYLPILIRAPLAITTGNLKCTVGVAYEAQTEASGGKPPYTWTDSGFPDGLAMATDGKISGTPTTPGTYDLTLYVKDEGVYSDHYLEKIIQITVLPPKVELVINGTMDASDDFVAVSKNTDPDLSTELSIKLPASAVGTYTADLSMKGADGNIKFESDTDVSLTPGVEVKVKMWGRTAGSAANSSTIMVKVKSGGTEAETEKTVTVIDGLRLSFDGRFCSTIDAINESWRPGMADQPNFPTQPLMNNAPNDVITADSPDHDSTISFSPGDQAIQLRTWSPTPNVKITKVEAISPPIELPNDILKGAEVHMTVGRFQHNNSAHEHIQNPVIHFKTGGASIVSISILNRSDDSAIVANGSPATQIDVGKKIGDAANAGNKLGLWLKGVPPYTTGATMTTRFHSDNRAFLTGMSKAQHTWQNSKFNASKQPKLTESTGAKAILGAQEKAGGSKVQVEFKLDSWDGWDLTGQAREGKLTTP